MFFLIGKAFCAVTATPAFDIDHDRIRELREGQDRRANRERDSVRD